MLSYFLKPRNFPPNDGDISYILINGQERHSFLTDHNKEQFQILPDLSYPRS